MAERGTRCASVVDFESGQNGHFLLYAKEKLPYAIERYRLEARRLYGMLDSQLGMTGAHIAVRGLLHRRHRLFPLGNDAQGAADDA